MFQVIQCTCCGKEGWHEIEFSFEHKYDKCQKCHHTNSSHLKFWFCDQECFFKWVKDREVEEKGVPCQDCHETGWYAGFESNGECNACKGTKRIKKRVDISEWVEERKRPKLP